MSKAKRILGSVGAAWGASGVCALLLSAIYRLTPRAREALDAGLTPAQWALAAVVCLVMAWSEGYRAFQKRFSPRTAARIRYLRDHPDALRTALAPLFAMGFFHATRRTKTVAFGTTFGIVVLVLLVHLLDQPWRGIIDAGVVLGLAWGVVSLVASVTAALTRADFEPSPEVPVERPNLEEPDAVGTGD